MFVIWGSRNIPRSHMDHRKQPCDPESFFRPDELSSDLLSVLQLTQRTNMVVYTELANTVIWVCRFCNKVSELTIRLSLKGVRT